MTLIDVLRSHAATRPDKAAVYCRDRAITFAELDASTDRLAQWLLDNGLENGDRVALFWPNSIELVQLFFAVFKAGLIAVPVNVRLKAPEVAYILEHSKSKLCFVHPAVAQAAPQVDPATVRNALPTLAEPLAAERTLPQPMADRVAAVLHTSGTTARPKGVTHTHGSLFHTAAAISTLVSEDDVGVAPMQILHAAALNGIFLPCFYKGATTALLPIFDPGEMLETIERRRATFLICLPALLQLALQEQARSPRDVSSLHTVLAGGDSVSLALQHKTAELFGQPLREIYGMTEALPICGVPPTGGPPGAMGQAWPDIGVRIVSSSGEDVAEGETGELVLHTPFNSVGYWEDPHTTAQQFRDGWYYSGDLASRDADGFYYFKGRMKQIIIRAGSNIAPQEVEEALYRHPAVLEAGVIGLPDELLEKRLRRSSL